MAFYKIKYKIISICYVIILVASIIIARRIIGENWMLAFLLLPFVLIIFFLAYGYSDSFNKEKDLLTMAIEQKDVKTVKRIIDTGYSVKEHHVRAAVKLGGERIQHILKMLSLGNIEFSPLYNDRHPLREAVHQYYFFKNHPKIAGSYMYLDIIKTVLGMIDIDWRNNKKLSDFLVEKKLWDLVINTP